MKQKKAIGLFLLLALFLFFFIRAIRLSTQSSLTKNKGMTVESSSTSKNASNEFDLRKLEIRLSEARTAIQEIHSIPNTSPSARNPFFSYAAEKILSKKEDPSPVTPISLSPDFILSGIIFDDNSPLAILGDEVKKEREVKNGFLITRILRDRVLLSKEGKEFVMRLREPAENFLQPPRSIPVIRRTALSSQESEYSKGFHSILRSETMQSIPLSLNKQEPPPINTLNLPLESEDSIERFSAMPEEEKIKTIQVYTFAINEEALAIHRAQHLIEEGFPDVRVERIENAYALRVGIFHLNESAEELWQKLQRISPSSFIRNAYYKRKNIFYEKKNG
ncbi:MAG: hypothetical protein WDA18_01115 [Candidatus Ratteibacteria bacterium]